MWVLMLESLGALLLLGLIVWWTMFSGRSKGELRGGHEHTDAQTEEAQGQPGEPGQDNSAPKG